MLVNWYNKNQDILQHYEELKSDLKLDKKDLMSHKKSLIKNEKEKIYLQKSKGEISLMTQKIVSEKTSLQSELAHHLADMINLLRAARSVIEQRLSDDLKDIKTIKNIELEPLPDFVQDRISEFISKFKEVDNETEDSKNQDEIDNKIATKEIEISNKMFGLFNEVVKLSHLKYQNKISNEAFHNNLKPLRKKYQDQINELDEKQLFIKKLLINANTGNIDEIRSALILLDDGDKITEKEIIESIKNDKTIDL